MKSKLLSAVFVVSFILLTANSFAQMPQGWWNFDDTNNLTAAVPGYGSDLELIGTHTAIAGPTSGNGAINIGVGSHYKLTHGFAPNGGGTKVNEYTLMFDFKVSNLGIWHTFYQTNTDVMADDGDYFKNTSGMLGTWALNYPTTPVAVDTWYRLVITVDLGSTFKTYINGALWFDHASQLVDDRWSLDSYLYLFGDNDGDDGSIDIAEVAIWNYSLTESEVAALGSVGTVLPVELTSFTANQINGVINLQWSTATELNNQGFEIQRKDAQTNWSTIGFVKGNGTTTNPTNYSYADKPSNSGVYSYRLKQIDFNGNYAYLEVINAEIIASEFKLHNNYPNPFNPSTTISYTMPVDGFVTLKVYNAIGELVSELINETQAAGQHQFLFNANNLPSGIYFAELKANENIQRIKMLLVK